MDKSALLTERLPREEVPIPGLGTVTVRGLSRYELHLVNKGTDEAAVIERRMLAHAMVDPELTVDDVEQWQRCSAAGELTLVTEAVQRLSGLGEGADKSGVPGAGEGPDA